MTSSQWTVLTLLLISGGIEALFSPISGTLAFNVLTGKQLTTGAIDPNKAVADQLAAPAVALIGFTVGLVLLLWLAYAVPKLAVVIAWAILILVILRYSSQILSISSATPTAQKGTGK